MTIEEKKKQIIVFTLENETYGAQINQIREIIKIAEITPVPKAPDAVLGVIDLRGKIVPIIDLRKELGLTKSPLTDINLVIITEATGKLVGLKVDAVNEVLKIEDTNIEETPGVSISGDLKDAFFGMAKVDEKVIILIDLKKVIPNREKLQAS